MTKPTWTEAEAQSYVTRMLRVNPLYDPAGALALRRKLRGLPEAAGQERGLPRRAAPEERAALGEELDRLRREFWTLKLDKLQGALAAIDTSGLPELRPLVERLRTAAACRPEFPRLAGSPGAYLPLVHVFKTAVVLPPGEAGPRKEQFLRSLGERRELKAAQRTARAIRSGFPQLYALERDWLETLLALKPRRAPGGGVTISIDLSDWAPYAPALLIGLIFLLRLLLLALR